MNTRWAAVLLIALAVPAAADGPKLEDNQLEISDPKLPLWELRPLDRRVYVVSLDGEWKKPPRRGATYDLNVRFGKGEVYSHKPINGDMFARGELRFMVPEYLLVRNKVADGGGKLTFSVTERAAVSNAKPKVVSGWLTVNWPVERRITSRPPDTKFTPPRPLDAFPLPDK